MQKLPLKQEAQKQEKNITRHIARNNSYPVKLIDKLQHKNITDDDNTIQNSQQAQNREWVTFRYHSPLVRKVTNIFKNTNLQIAYQATNTLWKILSTNNKHLNKYSTSGIYSLKCSTSNHIYVGQTGHNLKTRSKEHHRYIRTNNPKAAYAMHILNNNHQYGPIEETLQLITPCNKGTRMNCLENFYIQLHQKLGSLIEEQNTYEYNTLFALIQS
jgi:hypothetical protein